MNDVTQMTLAELFALFEQEILFGGYLPDENFAGSEARHELERRDSGEDNPAIEKYLLQPTTKLRDGDAADVRKKLTTILNSIRNHRPAPVPEEMEV